jgi:hypothetical protein
MRGWIIVAAIVVLAGCSQAPRSDVAVVNISRITANWPKFINYNNQLSADAAAIERSKASDQVKQRERDQLRDQFVRMQQEVTDDVRNAAEQVAKSRNYKLVVTREFAAYGGTDITSDVEKLLNITERVTPAP